MKLVGGGGGGNNCTGRKCALVLGKGARIGNLLFKMVQRGKSTHLLYKKNCPRGGGESALRMGDNTVILVRRKMCHFWGKLCSGEGI